MGGKAFAKSLTTPRMPPTVYNHVREQTLVILRQFYKYAESPIDAPGKVDYGDVDILVCEPLEHVTPETLAEALGSVRIKKIEGNNTTHFALPWPPVVSTNTDSDSDTINSTLTLAPSTLSDQNVAASVNNVNISATVPASTPNDASKRFIQLDLHVCWTRQGMEWELFQQAHGDLWNIVGSMVRRLGLKISNSGLYLRIEELKGRRKDMETMKLTEDPTEVLEFLGMDKEKFWRPFDTIDEMMAYAASCRFHDPARAAEKSGKRAELEATDRRRAKKRPLVAYWYDRYVSVHRENPPGEAAWMDPPDVVDAVKRVFGTKLAKSYEKKKAKGIRVTGIDKLWASIRKDLPIEGIEIGYVMKGIKKEVVSEAEGKEELNTVQQAYRDGQFERVASWAAENWKEVGERQKASDREKSTRNLLDKLEREREKERLRIEQAQLAKETETV